MIPQVIGKFIVFVSRLSAVQIEATSSGILLKKCVFILRIFIKPKNNPDLRKTGNVYPFYFSLANMAPFSRSRTLRQILRHHALNVVFLSLLDLQCGDRQNSRTWCRQHTLTVNEDNRTTSPGS